MKKKRPHGRRSPVVEKEHPSSKTPQQAPPSGAEEPPASGVGVRSQMTPARRTDLPTLPWPTQESAVTSCKPSTSRAGAQTEVIIEGVALPPSPVVTFSRPGVHVGAHVVRGTASKIVVTVTFVNEGSYDLGVSTQDGHQVAAFPHAINVVSAAEP